MFPGIQCMFIKGLGLSQIFVKHPVHDSCVTLSNKCVWYRLFPVWEWRVPPVQHGHADLALPGLEGEGEGQEGEAGQQQGGQGGHGGHLCKGGVRGAGGIE